MRAYLGDLAWLLGLLGFGVLMERVRRTAAAAFNSGRRVAAATAAAAFERLPVVASS